MKKILTIINLLIACNLYIYSQSDSTLTAQDSLVQDSLIFSEFMFKPQGGQNWGYVELVNKSTTTIDLSNYFIQTNNAASINGSNAIFNRWKLPLEGMLPPGETFLIVSSQINTSLDGWGNILYPDGYVNIYASEIADMLVGNSNQTLDEAGSRLHSSVRAHLVYKRKAIGDSVTIDIFGWNSNNDYMNNGPIEFIAGYQTQGDPITEIGYVRKTQVVHGSTDWDAARGDDLSNSEWIPMVNESINSPYAWIFTTLGNHGNTIEVGLSSEIASINEETNTITLPYGIRRDSVFRYFSCNPNVSWELKIGPDTAEYYIQSLDTLVFHAYGDQLTTVKYGVEVDPIPQTFSQVSPLVYKNAGGNFTSRYTVSNGYTVDTIGNIPFNERIDTVLKYLVFEEGMTSSIRLKNNDNRVDLIDGDELTITAADGSTKRTYKISVLPFLPSHNAELATVIFPGIENWENPNTFIYTDTMLTFKSNAFYYAVSLPEGTETSPAIIAVPESSRSMVIVKKAANLKGSEEERTASIVVTAEDDTTILEYNFLFTIERPTPPLVAEPFISDVSAMWGNRGQWIYQIFNPNDDYLDLSGYMLVKGSTTSLVDIGTQLSTNAAYKNVLRPGYKLDTAANGEPIFVLDYEQKTTGLNPKEVYSIAASKSFPNTMGSDEALEKLDFNGKTLSNVFDPGNGKINAKDGDALGLFKILNDSIKEGTKNPGDIQNDYELVDVINGYTSLGQTWVIYNQIEGKDSVIDFGNLNELFGIYRKPTVYTGNPISRGSFGLGTDSTVIKSSEWNVYGVMFPNVGDYDTDGARAMRDSRYENHVMITSVNIPYITSIFYLVEPGYEGEKSILGVPSGTSVETFMGNIIKADTGMAVVLTDASGSEKTAEDIIINSDKLISTSADGNSSVSYVITVGELDNNVTLTSTTYTIAVEGTTGTVSGIVFGSALSEVIDNINVPSGGAIMTILNEADEVVPLVTATQDTTNGWGSRVPTTASPKIKLEVVAQNGIDKCTYALVFAEDDLKLLSDVYLVDQESKIIDMITWTSVESFINNVIIPEGATIKIFDKVYNERTKGTIMFDDRVVVYNNDMSVSVTYWLKFRNEDGAGKGVEEALRQSKLAITGIYPNPANDYVTFDIGATIQRIDLFSISGKKVKTVNVNIKDSATVNLSELTKGVYIVKITDNKGVNHTGKLVKD